MNNQEKQNRDQRQSLQEEEQTSTKTQEPEPHQDPANPDSQSPPSSKDPKPQSQSKGMDKLLNKVPNLAPDGPLGTEQKGPLSSLGDPLGTLLSKSLSPLGHITGKIGNPHGEALLKVQRVAAHEGIASGEPKYLPDQDNGQVDKDLPGGERMGGKEQTGENPLGL